MLLSVNVWSAFNLGNAILITLYAFAPCILTAFIFTLRLDIFIKLGASVTICTVVYAYTEKVVDLLFGTNNASNSVNFNDWANNVDGNVTVITFTSLLTIGLILLGVGVFRLLKKRKK